MAEVEIAGAKNNLGGKLFFALPILAALGSGSHGVVSRCIKSF